VSIRWVTSVTGLVGDAMGEMAGARGGGVSGHGQRSATVGAGEGGARVEVAALHEVNSKCIC
jgi:hypothetical protein